MKNNPFSAQEASEEADIASQSRISSTSASELTAGFLGLLQAVGCHLTLNVPSGKYHCAPADTREIKEVHNLSAIIGVDSTLHISAKVVSTPGVL